MKKITIEFGEDFTPFVSNGQTYAHPKVTITTDPGVRADVGAGMLLVAYLQLAEIFINTHPFACQGCGAFQLHNSNFHRTNALMKEIIAGVEPYPKKP
jgi:hypothetical protein